MYLARTHEENRILTNFVRCKVYLMITCSFFQSKNIKKIMPVKLLDHVFSSKQIPNIPYAKTPRKIRFLWGNINIPDWDVFHFSFLPLTFTVFCLLLS